MELGMREWFLVIGGLMILGVLGHGAWLWLRARRNGIGFRYEREIPDIDVEDIDLLRGELPSGGARVRNASGELRTTDPGPGAEKSAAPRARPPRTDVETEARVPVLLDPIDRDVAGAPDAAGASAASPAGRDASVAEAPHDESENDRASGRDDASQRDVVAGAVESAEDESSPSSAAAQGIAGTTQTAQAEDAASPSFDFEQAPLFAGEPIVARNDEPSGQRRVRTRSRATPGGATDKETAEREAGDAAPSGPPEEVIVVNVLCRPGVHADGATLLEAITDAGLRFGDMNIFHRHSPEDRSRIDFSMASAVEPGTFDLGAVDDLRTPGVTLFMQLPGPSQPLEAFEDMVSIARAIAEQIGAELKDEQHSVMTAQTVEHCRQRIREFSLRQMSRRA